MRKKSLEKNSPKRKKLAIIEQASRARAKEVERRIKKKS